jgi:hypothetical protein
MLIQISADMRGTKPKEDASKKLQPGISTEKPRPTWMVQVCGFAGKQIFRQPEK